MSPVAAFWRLTLVLGVLAAGAHAAGSSAAGLQEPGSVAFGSSIGSGPRACRSFKLCHNSKGVAWTTVQVFTAMEPLMRQLKLEAATDVVEVLPVKGCLSSGCCCSTPVEVRVSLPVHKDAKTAAQQLTLVSDFIQFKLARALKNTVCTAGRLGDCPAAAVVAGERKLLSSSDVDLDMPALPEGLEPYDGKKPMPGAKAEAAEPVMPALPEGLVPYDGSKPLPGAKEAAAAEPAPPKIRQLLQQEDEDALAASEAAIAAVPAAVPAGESSFAGASVLESGTLQAPGGYGGRLLLEESAPAGTYGGASTGRSLLAAAMEAAADVPGTYSGSTAGRSLLGDVMSVGGYGGGGRSLLADLAPGGYGGGRSLLADMEEAGSYGGRSLLADATPGTYGGRSLLGEPAPKQQDKKQDKKPQSPKQAAAPAKQAAAPAKKAAPPAAAAAEKLVSSTSSSSQRQPGTCYCRYNPATASWALEQAACRAALYKRCGQAGNSAMLECSDVDAFYRGLAMPGSEPPHKDTLSAFLFVDCPPAPPCSCRSIVAGGETPTARTRCCADLKAHCQAPFSGLECEDVARFCRAGSQPTDPVGALFSYVLVKTHGQDCSDPRLGAAYSSVAAGGRSIETEEAVRLLAKAAVVDSLAARGEDFSEPDRVATLLTVLVGGLFAVAVAAVAVALLMKVGGQDQHAMPLLHA